MSAARTKTIISQNAPAGIQILVNSLGDYGIPADARTVYRGRNLITACPLLSGGEANVKAFRTPHLINSCAYGWVRGSKAYRSFHNALRLCKLGVNTPQPYAYIEQRTSCGTLRRSYYISRQLPDAYTTVRGVHKRPDFEALVEALAVFVAGFHRKGVLMKDLSPGNVMVRYSHTVGYRFALVDINRMEFGVTDTDRLVRSCGTLLDSEKGLTLFAGIYAGLMGLDPQSTTDKILERYRSVERRGRRKHRIKNLINGKA